jgi:hypothetical protein
MNMYAVYKTLDLTSHNYANRTLRLYLSVISESYAQIISTIYCSKFKPLYLIAIQYVVQFSDSKVFSHYILRFKMFSMFKFVQMTTTSHCPYWKVRVSRAKDFAPQFSPKYFTPKKSFQLD